MPFHVRAWLGAFEPEGITLPPDEFLRREGESSHETVKAVLRRSHARISEEKIERIIARKTQIFGSIFRVKWYPGAKQLIQFIRQLHYRLALVSGSPHELCQQINEVLGEAFNVIIAAGATERGKPFADPYLAALRALDLNAGECLAIENAPFGIRSARRAGLRCWAIASNRPPQELDEADRLFPDLIALSNFFVNQRGEPGDRLAPGKGPLVDR